MATTLSIIKEQFELDLKEHERKLGQSLNRARKERNFCDFVIKVGSKEICGHKVVLSEMSGYFRAMLAHKMKESESGVAEMKDVDADCMEICIEYMYTGKVIAPGSKIPQLIRVADMLELPKLCARIASFLESHLDADTFFAIRQIANTHNLQCLVESCNSYAKGNFASIATKEGFKSLDSAFILGLISSKEAKVSEADKCKSLLFWASFDPEKRLEVFEDVFETVKLEEVPKAYKLHLLENESLVSESKKCLRKLCKSELTAGVEKSSEGKTGAIAIFEEESKTIQTFKPKDKSWTVLHDVPDDIFSSYFYAVIMDHIVFVLASNKSSWKFDLSMPTAGWAKLPSRYEDGQIQAVVLKGQVYVFHSENSDSETIEKLNTSHTSWTKMTKPTPCHHEAIIAVKDHIYLFGGYHGSRMKRSTKFDPMRDSWTSLPEMPTARNTAAAAALDDKIYVLGGRLQDGAEAKTVECFGLQTQSWTTVKPMNVEDYAFNACVFDGRVYAVKRPEEQIVIEEYDPTTNTWKTIETSDKQSVYRGTFTLNI